MSNGIDFDNCTIEYFVNGRQIANHKWLFSLGGFEINAVNDDVKIPSLYQNPSSTNVGKYRKGICDNEDE